MVEGHVSTNKYLVLLYSEVLGGDVVQDGECIVGKEQLFSRAVVTGSEVAKDEAHTHNDVLRNKVIARPIKSVVAQAL